MAQQTALEWYMEKMNEYFDNASIHCGLDKEGEIYEQAKEMEKDQICEAWQHGKQQTFLGLGKVLTSEEYYNETYNK